MIGRTAAGGLNANQTSADLAFENGAGGFKHYLTTTHNGVANSNLNSFRFYLNNSVVDTDSSAPAIGNVRGLMVTPLKTVVGDDSAVTLSGAAKFQLYGTNASALGPLMQFTTNADVYPQIQIIPWAHNDSYIAFDNFIDSAGVWRSSIPNTEMSSRIHKTNSRINFEFGSRVAVNTTPVFTSLFNFIPNDNAIPTLQISGNTDNQQAGTLFLSQGDAYGFKIYYDAINTNDGLVFLERTNNVETARMNIKNGGQVQIGTVPNTTAVGASSLLLVDPAGAGGPHQTFVTTADIYPLRQFLNWSHDSVWDCFDCYHDGANWRNSNASSAFRLSKTATDFILSSVAAPTAGGAEAHSNIAWWNENGTFTLARPSWASGDATYSNGGAYLAMNTSRGSSGAWASMSSPGGNNDNTQNFYNNNGGWGWMRSFVIQTNAPPSVYFDGGISAASVTNRSSKILKKNISPIDDTLIALFDKIVPVKYQWRDKPYLGRKKGEALTDREKETKWHFGIIADDVAKIIPDMFDDSEQNIMDYDDEGKIVLKKVPVKAYSTSDLLALAIAKIKQLEKRIEYLEKKVK